MEVTREPVQQFLAPLPRPGRQFGEHFVAFSISAALLDGRVLANPADGAAGVAVAHFEWGEQQADAVAEGVALRTRTKRDRDGGAQFERQEPVVAAHLRERLRDGREHKVVWAAAEAPPGEAQRALFNTEPGDRALAFVAAAKAGFGARCEEPEGGAYEGETAPDESPEASPVGRQAGGLERQQCRELDPARNLGGFDLRVRPRGPKVQRRRGARPFSRVQEQRDEVHPGDAIDERMVGEEDDRETAAIGHAGHDEQLPERPRAVQMGGHRSFGDRAHFCFGGYRFVQFDLLGPVQVRLAHPDRPAAEGRAVETLVHPRHGPRAFQ